MSAAGAAAVKVVLQATLADASVLQERGVPASILNFALLVAAFQTSGAALKGLVDSYWNGRLIIATRNQTALTTVLKSTCDALIGKPACDRSWLASTTFKLLPCTTVPTGDGFTLEQLVRHHTRCIAPQPLCNISFADLCGADVFVPPSHHSLPTIS